MFLQKLCTVFEIFFKCIYYILVLFWKAHNGNANHNLGNFILDRVSGSDRGEKWGSPRGGEEGLRKRKTRGRAEEDGQNCCARAGKLLHLLLLHFLLLLFHFVFLFFWTPNCSDVVLSCARAHTCTLRWTHRRRPLCSRVRVHATCVLSARTRRIDGDGFKTRNKNWI